MTSAELILAVIAFIATVCGIAGAIYGIYSNKKKNSAIDAEKASYEGKTTATILTELGYIKASIDDIKKKQNETDSAYLRIVQDNTMLKEFKENTERRLDKIDSQITEILNK